MTAASLSRRHFLAGTGMTLAAPFMVGKAQAAEIELVDMLGRSVMVKQAPRRIVLLEARDIVTMGFLVDDPSALVVGWAAVDRIDSDVLRAQYARKDNIAIAEVGKQAADTLSLEGILSLLPDLVVANPFMVPGGKEGQLVERLESFGIPLIFSGSQDNAGDGSDLPPPTKMLPQLLRMWGRLLGPDAAARAEHYITFADAHIGRVAARLKGVKAKKTYLEVMSTYDDCCWAAGRRIWGDLLGLAGGMPLEGVKSPWYEKLQTEYLMQEQPAAYIATGGGYASAIRPAIGPGLALEEGLDGLRKLIARPGFEALDAVQAKRVYGIWSGLISIEPLNVVFVEVVAKWLHPALFEDLDPAVTLSEINTQFNAKPISGPLWVGLEAS